MSRIRDALLRAEQERSRNDSHPSLGPLLGPEEETIQVSAGTGESPAISKAILEEPESAAIIADSSSAVGVVAPAVAPSKLRSEEWQLSPRVCLPFGTGDAAGTEEFRTLRSRLKQLARKQKLKRVLISSTLPGEGKTFVAVNLALALAQQYGNRVLLVDGDLRRPTIHIALGAPLAPGLSDYLADKSLKDTDILQAGPIQNLTLMTAGKSLRAASERLTSDRLNKLLTAIHDWFDWIVIDSPPALGLSDASIISTVCDGVLMVAAAGKTPYQLAQKARREFQLCPVLGVVLNRVDPNQSYGRYYYEYETRGDERKKQ